MGEKLDVPTEAYYWDICVPGSVVLGNLKYQDRFCTRRHITGTYVVPGSVVLGNLKYQDRFCTRRHVTGTYVVPGGMI
jgi:hypothetical protein